MSGRAAAAPYQMLPPLTDEEREALRESIATFGVLQPVIVDENGTIIDGHHRAAIAAELGIPYATTILPGLTEDQKVEQALALNLGRRHLSAEQRAGLVVSLRARGLSVRWISERTGIPRTTVHRLVGGVPDGTPQYVTGKDGKAYRARTPMTIEAARALHERVELGIEDQFVALAAIYWRPDGGRDAARLALDTWCRALDARSPDDRDITGQLRDAAESWIEWYDHDAATPGMTAALAGGRAADFYRRCWRAAGRRDFIAHGSWRDAGVERVFIDMDERLQRSALSGLEVAS